MKTRRQNIALILSVCVVVVALLTPTVFAGEKIKLRYANWQLLEPRGELLQTLFAEFEEIYPDIEIVPEPIPYDAYNERIMNQLRAGQGPDIFALSEFSLVGWVEDGYLANLDDLIDLSQYDLIPQQSTSVINGKTYGLLRESFPYGGLICNMKLFEEAGLEPPTTPEELISVALQLTKSPTQWGLAHPFNFANHAHLMQGAMMVIKGFGGKIVEDDGTIGVDSPGFIAGVEYLKELYDSGCVPKGTDFKQQRQWYIDGNIAMVMDGSYWPGTVEAENPAVYEYIDVVALPFPDPASPYETNWYAINAASLNKEAAAKYLEFVLTDSFQERWALASGMGTGRSFTLDLVSEEYPWFRAFRDASPYGVVRIYQGFERETPQVRKMVSDAIAEVIIGRKTAEQAMKDLKRDLLDFKGRL